MLLIPIEIYLHELFSSAISIFPMEKQNKLSCFFNFVIDSPECLTKMLPWFLYTNFSIPCKYFILAYYVNHRHFKIKQQITTIYKSSFLRFIYIRGLCSLLFSCLSWGEVNLVTLIFCIYLYLSSPKYWFYYLDITR